MACIMSGPAPVEPQEETKSAGPMLSRDDILNASDIEMVSVDVPEWGGTVNVKMMSGHERDAFEASIAGKEMVDFRAKFAVAVLCDESGEALFTPQDIKVLTKKSAVALDRVFEAGKKLNRIGEEEEAALLDTLKKT